MNDNFVYEEFDPKRKGGRASGISEVFQATGRYIKKNIKALICFALVYVILIFGFIAVNVGSVTQVTSNIVKQGGLEELEDLTERYDDGSLGIDESNINLDALKETLTKNTPGVVMELFKSSTIMILTALALGILLQIVSIAFVTHINKWIFMLDRGFSEIMDGSFIKLIKSIGLNILFGIFSGLAMAAFAIIGGLAKDAPILVFIIGIISFAAAIYIAIAGSFAYYLITTNKYIGFGTAISAGFGIARRFIFDYIGKIILLTIAVGIIAGLISAFIAIISYSARYIWVISLLSIPWALAAVYATVFTQMLICDYANQYEFRTHTVVRDYDYYDIYDDGTEEYNDGARRYQDDEARSVDDFYNNFRE